MDMSRAIHPDTLAAILAGGFHPQILIFVDWPGDPVRVNLGLETITWDSSDWFGVGGFGDLSIPQEGAELVPADAILSMILPEDEIDAVLAAEVRNISARVYGALTTTPAGATLIGEPFEVFAGYVDGLSEALRVTTSPTMRELESSVQLELGTGPSARQAAAVVHSHEGQSAAHPGDTIGRLLINSVDRQRRVTW